MGKKRKCVKKTVLRKRIYLDLLPTEILEMVLKKLSFNAIEKAGDVTPRFGAIGRSLMKQATASIIKNANKAGGYKKQACLAALKALSACGPFRSPSGRAFDACNEIVAGKQRFHKNVMSAMSAMNVFLDKNLKETDKFTTLRRRYDHILKVIRILQSCDTACHTAVTQICPEMVTYKFTLFGCWLGLVWRGPNTNQLIYEEDRREILDVLLRMSFATNAEYPFRKFKYWDRRQKTCVMGYDRFRWTRPVKLEITANVYSADADEMECFRQRLATPCFDALDHRNTADSDNPSDDVGDVDLRMMIVFESRQALAWGCDRRFSYNAGWNDCDQ